MTALIAHVVHRFAVGGLENGVVNLIDRLDDTRWRHAVIALTDIDAGFARRIRRGGVEFVELNKPPGQGLWQWPKLWRTFRRLRPALVHTRNLAALEAQAPAFAAGVRARVHGEHGRDIADLHLTNRAHRATRRAYRPFVQRYVALSRDLAEHLVQAIGVPPARVAQIYNGVDTERFRPAPGGRRQPVDGSPFNDPQLFVVGTVGRMMTVKAQPLLAHAFVSALSIAPELRDRLRLVMVGDGPLRAECQQVIEAAGVASLVWMPGERADVPEFMRGLDCFVLPSLAEGISNTILEAMASGLPVLATAVGGNADLVVANGDGRTGELVPRGDVEALARGLVDIGRDGRAAAAMGRAGRAEVERRFSLGAMVAAYEGLYTGLIDGAAGGSH
jgi:sugar transferase (PEP-CTERM/EpsH1 system associated)